MRLNQFDYFRAIAILIIVAGHNINETFIIDTFAEKVLVNLIYGGTALFVFISGFFFHHVFYQKFDFKSFMIKKVQNVLVPYIVMTTIAMLLYLFTYQYLNNWTAKEIAQVAGSWNDTFQLYVEYVLFGGISPAYWYIPFIMIIFLMSPLFIWYIKLPLSMRLSIFGILFIVSMIIMRPVTHLTPLHHVLYYTPIYLLGINVSMNRAEVVKFIDGKAWLFGLLALLLAVMQAQFTDVVGHFEKGEIFSYEGIDILFVQEALLCFFFLALLQPYESKEIPLLKQLAAASFAIYFLHEFVKLVLKGVMVKLQLWETLSYLPEVVSWLVLVGIVVYVSLLVAQLAKHVLKTNSKYLTGW